MHVSLKLKATFWAKRTKGIYGAKLWEVVHAENASPTIKFKDFTAAVLKKQQELYQVKEQVKKRRTPFAMTYQATLRIRSDG